MSGGDLDALSKKMTSPAKTPLEATKR